MVVVVEASKVCCCCCVCCCVSSCCASPFSSLVQKERWGDCVDGELLRFLVVVFVVVFVVMWMCLLLCFLPLSTFCCYRKWCHSFAWGVVDWKIVVGGGGKFSFVFG